MPRPARRGSSRGRPPAHARTTARLPPLRPLAQLTRWGLYLPFVVAALALVLDLDRLWLALLWHGLDLLAVPEHVLVTPAHRAGAPGDLMFLRHPCSFSRETHRPFNGVASP